MIVTAFIFGLLGSLHCLGMCGPIAFLLPIDRKSKTKRLLQITLYHTGRLTTYALIGLLFGWLGKRLQLFGLQQQISIFIGLAMVVLVLVPKKITKKIPLTKRLYQFNQYIKNFIGLNLKKRSLDVFFGIGFFNGLLPCGLLYLAIFGAIASGGLVNSVFYMLAFGVGTIPLMTSAIYVANTVSLKTRRYFTKLIPVMICVMGLLFIVRGMGLGIKYISPSNKVSVPSVSAYYSCH